MEIEKLKDKGRNFEDLVKKSSELYSYYKDIEKTLVKLNYFSAEYVREGTPTFSNLPKLGCNLNIEKYDENASKLLEEANFYFLKKLNKKGIKIKLSQLELPTATSKNDHCNCVNFKGGMLDFLKNIAKKDSEKISELVSTEEIMALNSLTWAYHHGKVRDPYSFFPSFTLDLE